MSWWQVRTSREKTKQILQEFDELNRLGRHVRTHRISWHFLEPGCDLRAAIISWIQFGSMCPGLSNELAAYECINIDDTQGETPHKDLAHQFRRSTNTTLLKAASAARWRWNCEDWTKSGLPDNVRNSCWSQWKGVSRVVGPGRSPKESSCAKTRCDLLRFAYRMEPFCLHDWSGLFQELVVPTLLSPDKRLGPYQVEYLQFCFRQTVAWSIVDPTHTFPGNNASVDNSLTLLSPDESFGFGRRPLVIFQAIPIEFTKNISQQPTHGSRGKKWNTFAWSNVGAPVLLRRT